MSPAAGASRAAPAPNAAKPAGRPRQAPGTSATPRLALVAPTAADTPRAPFVVLVVALLVAGLAGLLFLHTALAEDSFKLHDLQVRANALQDDQQALEQALALEASPARLSNKAQALGMVRSENPAFIRLSDGRILGKPKAGVAPPPPPKPSPSTSPSPSASPSASGTAATNTAGKKGTKPKNQAKPSLSPSPGTGH